MALLDGWNLAQDANFQARVRQAACSAAVSIHNETFTALTPQRDLFGKTVLLQQTAGLPLLIAMVVANDTTVASQAGSPPVQASVTDTAINNAVSAAWNSFAERK